MKKKLFKIATVVCMSVGVMLAGQVTVLADEVKPMHEYTFDYDDDSTIYDSIIGKKAINGIGAGSELITGYDGKGKARYLDGSNYLAFSSLTLPVGTVSIRFKFKKDSTSVAKRTEPIISCSSQKELFYIGIGKYNNYEIPGSLWIYRKDNAEDNFELQTPKSICDGQWHDILFTWDGTKNTNSAKLYVDDMTTPISQTTALLT